MRHPGVCILTVSFLGAAGHVVRRFGADDGFSVLQQGRTDPSGIKDKVKKDPETVADSLPVRKQIDGLPELKKGFGILPQSMQKDLREQNKGGFSINGMFDQDKMMPVASKDEKIKKKEYEGPKMKKEDAADKVIKGPLKVGEIDVNSDSGFVQENTFINNLEGMDMYEPSKFGKLAQEASMHYGVMTKFKKLLAWNPLIAYLYKKEFIPRMCTMEDIYEAFAEHLNMARTAETRQVFESGWEILALDHRIDIFDMPKQWLVNPGVTPEMFFRIRRQFGTSGKLYKREARMISDWYFYQDKMYHVGQARWWRLFWIPFTLAWNLIIDNPVTEKFRLKLPVDRAWTLWPMMVEIFGTKEDIIVPYEHARPLTNGSMVYSTRTVKYLDWNTLEDLYLRAELPPVPVEPWGMKEYVYSMLN